MAIFPDEAVLAGKSLDLPSPFIPKLCILSAQVYTFHVILETVLSRLPQSFPVLFLY